MAGRLNSSLRRDAHRPMTPGCQVGDDRMSEAGSSSCCLTMFRASVSMLRSRCWRRVFSSSILRAMAMASSSLPVRSSCTDSSASAMRPAALSRGARRKPIMLAATGPSGMPHRFLRALMPGRHPWAIISSPLRTKIRFSSSIGTISAMVPRATRSRYCLRLGSWLFCQSRLSRSFVRSAITRLNATPTPASPLKGNGQSSCLGFIMA